MAVVPWSAALPWRVARQNCRLKIRPGLNAPSPAVALLLDDLRDLLALNLLDHGGALLHAHLRGILPAITRQG